MRGTIDWDAEPDIITDDDDEDDENGFEKLQYLTDEELYELAKMYVEKADRFLLVDIVVAGREAFFHRDV